MIETKSIAYTVAGNNGTFYVDTHYTKDGYRLIGIVGCALNNNYVHLVNLAPNNQYGFYIRNMTASSITATAQLTLLWQEC